MFNICIYFENTACIASYGITSQNKWILLLVNRHACIMIVKYLFLHFLKRRLRPKKQILPFLNSLRTQCALNSSNDFRIINLCFAIFRHFTEIGFQVLAQNSWKSLGMCEFSQYKSNAFWWYDVYSCFLFKLHCLCTARSTASLRWYSCHSSVYSRSTKT